MLLQELIDTFEELKRYDFAILRGSKEKIVIRFTDDKFYHLVGLHKTNINLFFPQKIISKAKKYKYMKSHVEKFNNILANEIKEKNTLELRVKSFHNILDLLKTNNKTILYNLKQVPKGSMYNGDYGLLKIYEEINCLLGLKIESKDNDIINCAPQSWMASNRINKLIENKKPIYMEVIVYIPKVLYPEPIVF